jgi:hypothetical protein
MLRKLFFWTCATIVAWVGGSIASGFEFVYLQGIMAPYLCVGIFVALAQWQVLKREFFIRCHWWLPATALGIAFCLRLTDTLALELTRYVSRLWSPLIWSVLGMLQWAAFRRRVSHAAWWIVAVAVGWPAGILAKDVLSMAPSTLFGYVATATENGTTRIITDGGMFPRADPSILSFLLNSIDVAGLFVGVAIAALITGLALVCLARGRIEA